MKSFNKFSKDGRVTLVSIEEFLERSNYLIDAKNWLFDDKKRPSIFELYYKITANKLILIQYGYKLVNFGLSFSEKVEQIIVAIRDGFTEYDLFNKRLMKLQIEHENKEKSNEAIKRLKEAMRLLPEYKPDNIVEQKSFEDCLVDTGYRTQIESLVDKYVVFDVETNGLRKVNDDLIGLSIFDPTTGICYNRLLPLDLQPTVLTGWINGITDDQLATIPHMSQKEVSKIIDFFNLKNRILLSYSGGKGVFDSAFLINYCKRHNLQGFENLRYENIKSMLSNPGYGCAGNMTKDNLCRLFGIDGVNKIHSSQNDCLLEWKLFEKVKDKNLFFINDNLYKYSDGYVVPITYYNAYREIARIKGIDIPHVIAHCTEVFKYSFPKKIVKLIKKFQQNITGIALENGINAKLNVLPQDNRLFLANNKNKLEYIGSLQTSLQKIRIETNNDGTIKSIDGVTDEVEESVDEVNMVTAAIIENAQDVFDYIKNEIFKDEEIMSQELCISDDNKVLALCDLSSTTKVVEIKTSNIVFDADNNVSNPLALQLFYESKNRDVYLLCIDIKSKKDTKSSTEAVNIVIYKVDFQVIAKY